MDNKSIHQILHDRNLYTYYQTIQNIQTKQLYGYETLIRGPEYSDLHQADKLFDAAQKYNLRDELERACLEVHLFNIIKLNQNSVFTVNISPKMLFDDSVLMLFTNYPHPDKIKIELTEHLPIEDWLQVRHKMIEFNNLGYQFWLDDVGCGFFDFELVKTVQPEVVKICIKIISKISFNDTLLNDLKIMVDNVHRYGGKLLAEGVENAQELNIVEQCGIDFAQGYFFDKPKEFII